jgi:hypothetical protein
MKFSFCIFYIFLIGCATQPKTTIWSADLQSLHDSYAEGRDVWYTFIPGKPQVLEINVTSWGKVLTTEDSPFSNVIYRINIDTGELIEKRNGVLGLIH